jgi:hypothetical protein
MPMCNPSCVLCSTSIRTNVQSPLSRMRFNIVDIVATSKEERNWVAEPVVAALVRLEGWHLNDTATRTLQRLAKRCAFHPTYISWLDWLRSDAHVYVHTDIVVKTKELLDRHQTSFLLEMITSLSRYDGVRPLLLIKNGVTLAIQRLATRRSLQQVWCKFYGIDTSRPAQSTLFRHCLELQLTVSRSSARKN